MVLAKLCMLCGCLYVSFTVSVSTPLSLPFYLSRRLCFYLNVCLSDYVFPTLYVRLCLWLCLPKSVSTSCLNVSVPTPTSIRLHLNVSLSVSTTRSLLLCLCLYVSVSTILSLPYCLYISIPTPLFLFIGHYSIVVLESVGLLAKEVSSNRRYRIRGVIIKGVIYILKESSTY